MAASYTVASIGTAFAANKCMISVFNPAGSGQVVRVYRIFALNNQMTAVTGLLTNLEIRKLSASTGGTILVPAAHDSSSTNLFNNIPLAAVTQTLSTASWATNVITYTTTAPSVPTVSAMTWANNTITVTTSAAHGYTVGQWVTVAGSTPAGYNGTYTIVCIPSTTTFVVKQTTNTGGTYTSGATLSAGHSYQVGQQITVTGVTPSGYNGTYTIVSIPTNNTLTVANAVNPGTWSSGGTIVPAILTGTNQTYTPTSLYRRVLWSTDEPNSGTAVATATAATTDEFQTLLPFGTIWSMGYADSSTEPITLRAGEGVGVINTGGSIGTCDFFLEMTVV